MLIGAHTRDDDPVGAARERRADVIQFFLADPQGWKAPKPHPQTDELAGGDLEVFVHSPYVVNVASLNNRIRMPSRKLVGQHAATAASVGAKGLVVHGGHLGRGEDVTAGIDNWRKLFERQADAGGFPTRILLENTAGGDNAMARHFDVLARLWEAIADYDVGFCLDTCHAFAAGEDLSDVVDRVLAITGRIDLVHCNNSRDEFGSTRDRHAPIHEGIIPPGQLVQVCAAAKAPVVLETRPDSQAEDIQFLRDELG